MMKAMLFYTLGERIIVIADIIMYTSLVCHYVISESR